MQIIGGLRGCDLLYARYLQMKWNKLETEKGWVKKILKVEQKQIERTTTTKQWTTISVRQSLKVVLRPSKHCLTISEFSVWVSSFIWLWTSWRRVRDRLVKAITMWGDRSRVGLYPPVLNVFTHKTVQWNEPSSSMQMQMVCKRSFDVRWTASEASFNGKRRSKNPSSIKRFEIILKIQPNRIKVQKSRKIRW